MRLPKDWREFIGSLNSSEKATSLTRAGQPHSTVIGLARADSLRIGKHIMEFGSDERVQRIPELAQEFFEHVLYDEEPLFVSDEATIWDVSMAAPEELRRRCSEYYGTSVSLDDLKQPLWKLLPQLSARRKRAENGECGIHPQPTAPPTIDE
jgi:hypothetical protein